ncbi:MAG TPA: type I polyketide synthase, partial [Candidatus Elarobacter sp.]|nr:type I polyketide synthase [Candidatus Elarobacter sp.]
DVEALYDPDPDAAGTTYSRWAGLVDGVDLFDEEFFGISPREAAQTDPQQRLFLEGVWTALEHAGIAPPRLRNSATGVFVGVTTGEYAKLHDRDVALEDVSAYAGQGLANNAIAGRVSHILGLHGPSMSIDTACSSSLVAIDRACRSLRDGESTLAIAGGVNVLAVPEPLVAASRWGMFAADGHCKSFAAGADGFVRGEGCGVLVLKRLSQAQADGDRILALILGSAVNHDGPSSGLTVPSGLAQQAVLRAAIASAGIEPGDVSYVEAHGTGTSLGDPIEAEALGAAIGAQHADDRPLLIGSVKTNLGHLESASGVAGLIKIVLALAHRELPPQIHFDAPSPQIRWDALRLRVVGEQRAWEPVGGRRIAGVSSFGFSGTNAHVIVGEAPEPAFVAGAGERPIEILSLSARTETALRELVQRYAARLTAEPLQWADLCHTADTGRARFAHQLTVRGADPESMRAGLAAYLAGTPDPRVVVSQQSSARPKIAFLFTGQGAQYAGMGRALYAGSPTVRRIIDAAEALLADRLDVPLGAVMRGEHPEATRLLNLTLYTQPALYVLEYALAEMWRELGVEPYAVIGHSLGEYTAAAVTGVFGLEEGLLLVADRARLMHEVTADGTMLVVNAPEAQVAPLLAGYEDRVAVAGVNAPSQVTLSGARAAIEEIAAVCAQRGWRTVPLPVSQAFHSPLLDEMAAAFETRAAQLSYAPPNRKLVSNLTGAPIGGVDAAYWRAHTRQAVRFADGVRALETLGCDVLLELGPRPTLLTLAQQIHGTTSSHRYVTTLKGVGQDWDSVAAALQQLHAAGVPIDWAAWDRDFPRRIVDAPSYPFERHHHWITPSRRRASPRKTRATVSGVHPLLGERLRSALPGAQFEAELGTAGATAWLGDHRIGAGALVPATALIEMMLAAGTAIDPPLPTLTDLTILAPLQLNDEPRIVQTIVDASAGDVAAIRIFAEEGGRFRLHAQGRLTTATTAAVVAPLDLAAIRARCAEERSAEQHYAALTQAGADFGPAFRGVAHIWAGEHEALAQVEATAGSAAGEDGRPHPALLDACFQVADSAIAASGTAYLPFALERFALLTGEWPSTVYAYARVTKPDRNAPQLELIVADSSGVPLARAHELIFKKAEPATADRARDSLYEVRWQPAPAVATNGAVTERAAGRWLVLGDRRGIAMRLSAALEAAGGTCVMVADGAPMPAIAAALASGALRGIVDCRPIDAAPIALAASPRAALGETTAIYATALELLQTVAALDDPPPATFVTIEGAPLDSQRAVPANAILTALRKTAQAEHPDLQIRTIDLDGNDSDCGATLLAELVTPGEPDVALQAGRRFVPRLLRSTSELPAVAAGELVELQPAASGVIDEVAFAVRARRAPQAHEVEIDVRATGLNFRDALNALGMLPGTLHKIGGECAGVVVRAGTASGFSPGERVMAFCPGESGSFVTVAAAQVERKPERLSYAQAAALPVVTMTALYALERVAKLKRGERVLIHAAAGGLGLAAVQLALGRGAIVFATAGSPEKRDYVRALGVEHVMDSRKPGFADEIAARTAGRGVDVVLNSLGGAFIAEGLRSLARGGRFVEVGKRDVLTPDEARALRPDVAYTLFDLGEEAQADASLIPALFAQLRAMIDDGTLQPLPVNAEPYANARVALADLARARRIGKVVLVHGAHGEGAPPIRADASYAITGGFGALGLQAAAWLADRGATSLVIVGRHERDDAQPALQALRAGGVDVRAVVADCTDPLAMRALAASLPEAQPLRGVVHCAGALADATLLEQAPDAFVTVGAPKVAGALAVHQAAAAHDLELFVLFSSAAATLGSAGQANYAAANAALGEVGRILRARGFAALSVAWGPWAGGGMAASEHVRRRLEELVPFDAASAFATVEVSLADGLGDPVALQVRSWDRFLALRGVAGRDPFFAALRSARNAAAPGDAPSFGATLATAEPAARRRLLLDHLQAQAGQILGVRAGERIDEQMALHDRGLDSLMSVELRNALGRSLGVKLSPTLAFDYPTLAEIADHVLGRMFEETAVPADLVSEVETIAALSDAEAEALLLRELEGADV